MTRKHKKNRYVSANRYSFVAGKRFRKIMEAIGKNFIKFDNPGQMVEEITKSNKKRRRRLRA